MRRAASLLLAMVSSPAFAQVPAGHFASTGTVVAQSVVSTEMGRCVVAFDRGDAVALVRVPAADPHQHQAIDRLMPGMQRCLKGGRSASLDASYLRGGIAEALLEENGHALIRRAATMAPVAPVRLDGGAREPVVSLMGCAAAAQPSDAAALLDAAPASPEEGAAFRAMIPALQACAPAASEVRFNPARMRPATAIAVYRRVAAQ